MSANSVLPSASGICRADRSEYLAGTSLNELSECQSMLPKPNRRRRSSRASTWLFLSRLEMSFSSMLTRRSSGAAMSPVASSSGPSDLLKASCWSSSIFWSWNTSTPNRSMPAWTASTSCGDSGRARSMPETSPAKNDRPTGSMGLISMAPVYPVGFSLGSADHSRNSRPLSWSKCSSSTRDEAMRSTRKFR